MLRIWGYPPWYWRESGMMLIFPLRFVCTRIGMTISHAVATKTIDGTSLGELRIGKTTDGA